jgi:hypothetical protein
MNISVGRIAQGASRVRSTFKAKKWVRVTAAVVVALGMYTAGEGQGRKQMDPRHTGGPGSTVTEQQLQGRWDGVLTDASGNSFCLRGWPCEDAGLDD